MVEDFVKSAAACDKEVSWLPNANAYHKIVKIQGYEISMNTPLKIRLINAYC